VGAKAFNNPWGRVSIFLHIKKLNGKALNFSFFLTAPCARIMQNQSTVLSPHIAVCKN